MGNCYFRGQYITGGPGGDTILRMLKETYFISSPGGLITYRRKDGKHNSRGSPDESRRNSKVLVCKGDVCLLPGPGLCYGDQGQGHFLPCRWTEVPGPRQLFAVTHCLSTSCFVPSGPPRLPSHLTRSLLKYPLSAPRMNCHHTSLLTHCLNNPNEHLAKALLLNLITFAKT